MSMPAERLESTPDLAQLLEGIAVAPAIPLTGIASDSRKLQAGNLFLAYQGATSHGLDFIDQAEAAGVAAIAWDASTGSAVESGLPMIAVKGLAEKIGEIANRWFDFPSRAVNVIGVTGTNGKTTVAWLISQALNLLEQRCGYVGTLGVGVNAIDSQASLTTPACIDLHAAIAGFRDVGAKYAAIEVSSHALEQLRVDGMRFDSAIFTNLTRDHIDYHGSMQAYFESKARLFLDYDVRNRIVSLDSGFGVELAELCGSGVVTVSTSADRVLNGRPYVFVSNVVPNPTGSRVSIASSWGSAEFSLQLPGDFNVANAIEVLALLLCDDVPLPEACDILGKVSAPPGRMELANLPGDVRLPKIYVDYSHTPDSLEAALTALRRHCAGKLWCVFGCGGDRDRGKRPMMGGVAERLADCAIVTSDNPRTELPGQIIDDILEGMNKDAVAIVDRASAIAHAVAGAAPDDIVLIAGKGHEDYQLIGDLTFPFSDLETARDCLLQRGAEST
jgi:UDP-N-acetylmuramoyl-L-alanyl-D-glutamate--2,6-diaminopimelate ligase